MPYYHVYISWKERGGGYSTTGDFDLDEQILRDTIAEPYMKGESFICGGKTIDPYEIEVIRISETKELSSQLLPKIKRRYTAIYPYFYNMVQEGKNATNRYILHPPPPGELSKTQTRLSSFSKNIFIVHGRDHKPMTELKNLLKELGLNPIVLHEKPSGGSKTLVEKLEKYSDVGYAFVLLTPDDVVVLTKLWYDVDLRKRIMKEMHMYDNELTRRARQNVVLEFGYFIGKLGRERVCCLYKGDIELPSDMSGIVYVPFKESISEVKDKIVKELQEAGYDRGKSQEKP